MKCRGIGARRCLERIGRTVYLAVKSNVQEVRYFHPTGKGMPNSVYVHRGGFLWECIRNKAAFARPDAGRQRAQGLQDEAAIARQGGIIVFPADTHLVARSAALHIFYRVGNFFRGRYIDGLGTIFDERSTAVDIRANGTVAVIRLAEDLRRAFRQEVVLVNDFTTGRIYLVGRKSSAYSRPRTAKEV